MHQSCPRCGCANPAEAVFCFHDGNLLARHAPAGQPEQPGTRPFPSPFVFPSGQSCQNFDQFALACQKEWATAVKLLRENHLERFFGALGRIDLVMATRTAAGFPDGDRGLDQLLAQLPTRKLAAPRLQVPTGEVNLGPLAVGADRHFDLHISNAGMRLLYGSVMSDCKWLGFGNQAGAAQKLFQCGDATVVRVQVRGRDLRAGAKDLEGRLIVESNGGTATVLVRATVAVKPFPSGALAGARTPRQIAAKAREAPKAAAELFEKGLVADWFRDNGWTYPVEGPAANGVAVVQQFFEALGLTRPPRGELSEPSVRLRAAAGERVEYTLYVKTEEKRPVFAHARGDQPWLKVHPPRLKGAVAAIPLEVEAVPDAVGKQLEARVHVRSNGNQRFVVPVSLAVQARTPPPPAPRGRSFFAHLMPLGLLLLTLLGLSARDFLRTPPDPEVVIRDEPVEQPRVAAPLKVEIQDEPEVWTREVVAKVVYKIEDEPEERSKAQVPPVKVEIRDEPEEGAAAEKKNLPVDPESRISYRYDKDQHFGITILKDRAGQPLGKRITYSSDGYTNNTRLKIDGRDMELGKGSKWLVRGGPIPDDPEGKTKNETKSVVRAGEIEITQFLAVVPSKQPVEVGEAKELKYLLDTVLVRYVLENKGKVAHTAGLRVQVDTWIGSNDAVPFTIPGRPGLCSTVADLRGKEVPNFIQALEFPDLQKPGLVAHMTLKLGGKLEPPARVCLAHLEDWKAALGGAPWETKLEPFNNGRSIDSAVFLYWNEKTLKPGQKREFGFAYGLGGVEAAEGAGKLGITLGGAFEPGQIFTVTAYVTNPVANQKLTLEVPDGLQPEGKTTVPVPRAKGNPPTGVVTWTVKVLRTGEFRIRVRSSTGLAQSKTIVIASGENPDPGKLALKLDGPFEPGKAFAVAAEVMGPAPEQKIRLELPGGLERLAGEAEQSVPPAGDGEKRQVRWEVKVNEVGAYRVGIRSSTGAARAKTLTIARADQGGAVRIAFQGDVEPGKAFALLARVDKPASGQKLTLILPDQLERVGGAETEPVPDGGRPVTWKVKVREAGKYTLRVRSSTGVTYPRSMTIERIAPNLGRFDLDLVGAVAPGKDFEVVARVNTPVPRQELTLTLPPGLQLVAGTATQRVPPSEGSSVTWGVRVVERGRPPVRVESSTGIARTKTITISGGDASAPTQIFGK